MKTRKPKTASVKYLSGEDFRTWRLSRGLTLREVGEWLGVTTGNVHIYEKVGCIRAVALALSAIDKGLPPISVTDEDRRKASEGAESKNEHQAPKDRKAKVRTKEQKGS